MVPVLKVKDASTDADRLLAQARRDPLALAAVQQEWIDDTVAEGLKAAEQSPANHDPALRRGSWRLRDTWLRDAYEEMAPALTNLGVLVGRAMQAQGLIALCNATIMFLALSVLGVEHAALLAGAVFLLCLVPTLGTIIAWVLLAAVALVQPGGGVGLALKASAAVVIVVLLETFVFSPRILGRMMELHPVLIIAILPLAQYFFGVWGLILATPVTVYVIHVVILQRGLPGIDSPAAGADRRHAGRPASAAPAIREQMPIS